METRTHENLKRLALAYVHALGCQAAGMEVPCPFSRYRIDVAGYQDRVVGADAQSRRCEPRTIMIECKQSRSDFLRDSEQTTRLIALRTHLDKIRESIEEHRIKQFEPQLRCDGTSLFSELDDWDFSRSRLRSYREVLRKLRRIDEKLHGETKFFLISRYRLADQLFIAAPRGLIRRSELPPGWGLLESPRRLAKVRSLDASMMSVAVPAPAHVSKPAYRARMLRNIAVAASQHLARRYFAVGDSGIVPAPQLFSTSSRSPTLTK
jgi:hypothetical protein